MGSGFITKTKTMKSSDTEKRLLKNNNRVKLALSDALISFSKESNEILHEIGIIREDEEEKIVSIEHDQVAHPKNLV